MDDLAARKRYDAIRRQYGRNATALTKAGNAKAAEYLALSTASDAEIAAHLQQAYRRAMTRLNELRTP